MVAQGYGSYSNLHDPATTWQLWDTERYAKLHTCATKGQHMGTAQVQTCGGTGRGVVLVHDRHMNRCAHITRWRYWDLAYMIKDPCATIPWHWIMADTGMGALTTAWHWLGLAGTWTLINISPGDNPGTQGKYTKSLSCDARCWR